MNKAIDQNRETSERMPEKVLSYFKTELKKKLKFNNIKELESEFEKRWLIIEKLIEEKNWEFTLSENWKKLLNVFVTLKKFLILLQENFPKAKIWETPEIVTLFDTISIINWWFIFPDKEVYWSYYFQTQKWKEPNFDDIDTFVLKEDEKPEQKLEAVIDKTKNKNTNILEMVRQVPKWMWLLLILALAWWWIYLNKWENSKDIIQWGETIDDTLRKWAKITAEKYWELLNKKFEQLVSESNSIWELSLKMANLSTQIMTKGHKDILSSIWIWDTIKIYMLWDILVFEWKIPEEDMFRYFSNDFPNILSNHKLEMTRIFNKESQWHYANDFIKSVLFKDIIQKYNYFSISSISFSYLWKTKYLNKITIIFVWKKWWKFLFEIWA